MSVPQIADIILTVLVFVIGAISAYKAAGKNIYSKVSYLITEMAKTNLTGSQKMSAVVSALYEYVPSIFKRYFNSDKLEEITQSTYDTMKEFAEKEIEEAKSKKK